MKSVPKMLKVLKVLRVRNIQHPTFLELKTLCTYFKFLTNLIRKSFEYWPTMTNIAG